jgi:hypothetical protein
VVERADIAEDHLVLQGHRLQAWGLAACTLDQCDERIPHLALRGAAKAGLGCGKEAIEVLTVLVASDDAVNAGPCRRGVRDTVLAVRKKGNGAAGQIAAELVGRLVGRGYEDFIDLV